MCTRRLQAPRDDSAVQVQWFSRVIHICLPNVSRSRVICWIGSFRLGYVSPERFYDLTGSKMFQKCLNVEIIIIPSQNVVKNILL